MLKTIFYETHQVKKSVTRKFFSAFLYPIIGFSMRVIPGVYRVVLHLFILHALLLEGKYPNTLLFGKTLIKKKFV